MEPSTVLPHPYSVSDRILESSPYFMPGLAAGLILVLDDFLGWIGAAVVTAIVVLLAAVLLRKLISRSRRRHIAANLLRGVVEAVVRFPDEAGRSPNSGWKAGSLELTDAGFRFQQLNGRATSPVGPPLDLVRPKLTGRRPMEFKQAPELQQGFEVTSFVVSNRDVEVAAIPAYVRQLELHAGVADENSAT